MMSAILLFVIDVSLVPIDVQGMFAELGTRTLAEGGDCQNGYIHMNMYISTSLVPH